MSDNKKAVFGIYKTSAEVERAIDALKAEGFTPSDISVLMPKGSSSHDFAHTKGTKSPEGAAAGAGAGAIIGGALGLLAGFGSLTIPGVGPFIAAGPLMAALAGLGAGGALGGISGGLIGMGIPEYLAKRYEGSVKVGGILLSVHMANSDQITRAESCLKRTGAEDIANTTEEKGNWAPQPNRSKEQQPNIDMY